MFDVQCGDPDRPEGIELGYHPTDALILTRPYPRSFPSPATYSVDVDERSIVMEGKSRGGIPLVLWIPGVDSPQVEGSRIKESELHQVAGGWILTAMPKRGQWNLRAQGSPMGLPIAE